jgi:hypothetical protein
LVKLGCKFEEEWMDTMVATKVLEIEFRKRAGQWRMMTLDGD